MNSSVLPFFRAKVLVVWALAAIVMLANLSAVSARDEDAVSDSLTAMLYTSKAFRRVADSIRPSLVTIESFGGVSAIEGRIGGIRQRGEGNTTGVLISGQGHIITSSFNFIQSPPVITIVTADGQRRVAKMLGKDKTRKLCLLKIEQFDGIAVPEIADVDDIRVGQWAISVGVGYGDTNPAISSGIISATNRIGGRAIQTDANISPANYGGPLLDIEGRLLGICVPMNPQSQAAGAGVEWYDSGIGFAIPVSNLTSVIERLKKGETISPAFLGIRTEPNKSGGGLRVAEVIENTAAAEAGLGHGDIVLKINDEPVDDLMSLKRLLNQFEAGQEVKIEFKSSLKNEVITATAKLGQLPAPKADDSPMEPPKIR